MVDINKIKIKKDRREVPSVDGAWVDFFVDLSGKDQMEISKETDKQKVGELLVGFMVADWNFYDGDKKIDVGIDGIALLPMGVQNWIAGQIGLILGFREDKKKD